MAVVNPETSWSVWVGNLLTPLLSCKTRESDPSAFVSRRRLTQEEQSLICLVNLLERLGSVKGKGRKGKQTHFCWYYCSFYSLQGFVLLCPVIVSGCIPFYTACSESLVWGRQAVHQPMLHDGVQPDDPSVATKIRNFGGQPLDAPKPFPAHGE